MFVPRAVLLAVLVGCSSPSQTIVVHTPPDLAMGTDLAAKDLVTDLGRIANRPVERAGLSTNECVAGEIHIAVLGHEHDRLGRKVPTKLASQAYSIDEWRCGEGGRFVVLRGGSLPSAQWAVYDLMERLGVRYLHPEQTLYPTTASWPAQPIHIVAHPRFERRALHAHRTHPIELSAPLDASPATSALYQKRWVDWNVKVRHTDVDAVDASIIGTYAYDRGFARDVGINLLSSQQGSNPVLDPDDPRPEHEQITTAIDAVMADVPGAPAVNAFGFQINPNEFTTVDEDVTIERMTFITDYVTTKWPGVEVRTINHGTGQGPGPKYGVRFFDLSEFAPPQLSVQAHTLMFYDLDRPAPVYGNTSFNFMRDWMIEQQAVRRIHYYPESSWWLTFDLPVPLFLAPVSLEARQHDIELLAPYIPEEDGATHGIVGHLTFSSGQEWGYWLIDYCTARMTWDTSLGWVACVDHVTSAFAQGDAIRDVLAAVGAAQVDPMRDPAILAMLVGSDDETEAAELAGIEFHPLPPRPADVLGWSDAQVQTFAQASLAPLPAMAAQYATWATTMAGLAAAQTEDFAPWIAEFADSLRITGLRFAHAHAVYSAALELRAAVVAHDFAAVQAAEARVAEVRAITEAAREIVTAREAHYRYPAEYTIAGDEPGTPGAIANSTIYPYRYLSRTHRLFYWTRPDDQLAAMFGVDTVAVNDRILKQGTPLVISLLADAVTDLAIAWGDGTTATVLAPHTYAAQGVFDWTLDALHSLGAISHADRVAVVARRIDFVRGSLAITSPAGAALLNGLLPGLAIGLGTDTSGTFMAIGEVDAGTQVLRGTLRRVARTGLVSTASDLRVELKNVGAITVYGAVLTFDEGAGPAARTLSIAGELSTDEVIALIVATGGFDAEGARNVVAAQLGYTPETLPARVAVQLQATGSES